jgi:hypothetical protein
MRQRILTERERREIEAFLEGKKKSTIIRMLKYRAKKFLPTIKEEIELLETLLEQG